MLLVRNKREALAEWVRAERFKRNWSQVDLADRMNKAKSVINKIEAGSNEPSLETLDLLARAFGYPITEVLKILGYDIGDYKDTWLQGMNHKINLIPEESRGTVEKLLEAFIEDTKRKKKK